MDEPRLWQVTLTVCGAPWAAEDVRAALERLAEEWPALVGGRYAADCAELCYWEESPDLAGAIALALRLWSDYAVTASLPPWSVAAVAVADRDMQARLAREDSRRALVASSGWRPFPG